MGVYKPTFRELCRRVRASLYANSSWASRRFCPFEKTCRPFWRYPSFCTIRSSPMDFSPCSRMNTSRLVTLFRRRSALHPKSRLSVESLQPVSFCVKSVFNFNYNRSFILVFILLHVNLHSELCGHFFGLYSYRHVSTMDHMELFL